MQKNIEYRLTYVRYSGILQKLRLNHHHDSTITLSKLHHGYRPALPQYALPVWWPARNLYK